VVGLADARLSEVAVAFVRVEPRHNLTAPEVIDYCRGKIASYKVPRHVVIVDELPMTGSGKVQKGKLRDEARRRLAGPSA
jgi:fatty-acyl-CoA synthase